MNEGEWEMGRMNEDQVLNWLSLEGDESIIELLTETVRFKHQYSNFKRTRNLGFFLMRPLTFSHIFIFIILSSLR